MNLFESILKDFAYMSGVSCGEWHTSKLTVVFLKMNGIYIYIYIYVICQKWNYANVSSLSIPTDEILSGNENFSNNLEP